MGLGSELPTWFSTEITLENPSQLVSQLKAQTLNPEQWAIDGATFVAGEGLLKLGNYVTDGAIANNRMLSMAAMGGSFGFINGSTAELQRENAAGEKINVGKILGQGGLEAGVNAVGAMAGAKISETFEPPPSHRNSNRFGQLTPLAIRKSLSWTIPNCWLASGLHVRQQLAQMAPIRCPTRLQLPTRLLMTPPKRSGLAAKGAILPLMTTPKPLSRTDSPFPNITANSSHGRSFRRQTCRPQPGSL